MRAGEEAATKQSKGRITSRAGAMAAARRAVRESDEVESKGRKRR